MVETFGTCMLSTLYILFSRLLLFKWVTRQSSLLGLYYTSVIENSVVLFKFQLCSGLVTQLPSQSLGTSINMPDAASSSKSFQLRMSPISLFIHDLNGNSSVSLSNIFNCEMRPVNPLPNTIRQSMLMTDKIQKHIVWFKSIFKWRLWQICRKCVHRHKKMWYVFRWHNSQFKSQFVQIKPL